MTDSPVQLPTTWAILARAIHERRAVRARYHGHDRILCPHILGWKRGRPKLLAYQADGTTSTGSLPARADQRWRSLFVEEIDHIAIAWGTRWQTAQNYAVNSNCVDQIAFAVSYLN
jgi:hypothetical protein